MSGPLTGLQVAVTRPAGQADDLLAALRAAGASAIHLPLLAIVPVSEAAALQVLQTQFARLADYQHLVFVSRNAAEQAIARLREAGGHWPASAHYYAVGSSTAAALTAEGLAVQVPARMDSEGLLALPALQLIQGERCLVMRGVGGRETLAAGLRARGATVDYCELYRREPPAAAAGHWQAWLAQVGLLPKLVCINSAEGLDNLLALMPDSVDNAQLAVLVPGERVAAHARQAGYRQVICATNALDDTILSTAIQWYRQVAGGGPPVAPVRHSQDNDAA